MRIRTSVPGNKTDALSHLMSLGQPRDVRYKPTWTARLPEIFHESGLTFVDCDVKDPSPEMIMPLHESNLVIHELLARKAQNSEWTEKIKKILPKVLHEARAGAAWDFTLVIVIGRKPL